MAEWMQQKEYKHEAKYLQAVRGWRRACDERGLTSQQRSQFNQNLLHFILDEVMPWHCDDITDFSLLEVNRYALYVSNNHTITRVWLYMKIHA